MDHRIENLASTTFGGKRISRHQIVLIQETVNKFSALSRRELAHTICEQLGWYTAQGENKVQAWETFVDLTNSRQPATEPPIGKNKEKRHPPFETRKYELNQVDKGIQAR